MALHDPTRDTAAAWRARHGLKPLTCTGAEFMAWKRDVYDKRPSHYELTAKLREATARVRAELAA